MIDTTGPGGAETVFLQLARSSMENGYQAIAVIRGPGWVKSQLEEMEIPFYVIDCKGSFNISFLRQLLKVIASHNIDMIQTHLFGSAVYGCLAGLISRIPVFSTLHGEVDISPDERFKILKLLILRLGATKLITITDRVNQMLNSLPILSKRNILTIYNGIDETAYVKTTSDLKEKFNIGSAPLIGSVGNIRPAKNYPLALDVLKTLHDRGTKAHYFIAGQGSKQQMEPLEKLIKEYNLGDYVHILGFVDDVQSFLSALDIFIMTSSSEGHPLALTQAMINGLPIVSTPSGVEEIAVNNEEALISDSHQATALADKVQLILDNPEIAEKISTQAKNKALCHFSLNSMTSKYLSLYHGN